MLPGSVDVAEVRLALERELGETVSQRLAARLLGVSHTALRKWIKSGDLPMVTTRDGRAQVPVPALLDLIERVEEGRGEDPGRYALAPVMRRNRDAASRLVLDAGAPGERSGHARARARGLAYHQTVARRLRRPMVDEARHVLFRWRQDGRIDERYAERWEQLLSLPLAEIRRRIVEVSPEADDLRQNSPLAGLISEPERRRILAEVR